MCFIYHLRLREHRPKQKSNGQEGGNGDRSTVGGGLGISSGIFCLGVGVDLDLEVQRRRGLCGVGWHVHNRRLLGGDLGTAVRAGGEGGSALDGGKSQKKESEDFVHHLGIL
jgi:hypothetical protein